MFRFIRGKVFGGHTNIRFYPWNRAESTERFYGSAHKFLWIKQAEGWEQQEVIIVAGI